MERPPNDPDATQPRVPRGAQDTQQFRARESSETQPYVPLKRVLPEIGGADVEQLFDASRLNEPEFVREVEVALRGTMQIPDIHVEDISHVEGNRFKIVYSVRDQRSSVFVERRPSTETAEEEHPLVEESEL